MTASDAQQVFNEVVNSEKSVFDVDAHIVQEVYANLGGATFTSTEHLIKYLEEFCSDERSVQEERFFTAAMVEAFLAALATRVGTGGDTLTKEQSAVVERLGSLGRFSPAVAFYAVSILLNGVDDGKGQRLLSQHLSTTTDDSLRKELLSLILGNIAENNALYPLESTVKTLVEEGLLPALRVADESERVTLLKSFIFLLILARDKNFDKKEVGLIILKNFKDLPGEGSDTMCGSILNEICWNLDVDFVEDEELILSALEVASEGTNTVFNVSVAVAHTMENSQDFRIGSRLLDLLSSCFTSRTQVDLLKRNLLPETEHTVICIVEEEIDFWMKLLDPHEEYQEEIDNSEPEDIFVAVTNILSSEQLSLEALQTVTAILSSHKFFSATAKRNEEGNIYAERVMNSFDAIQRRSGIDHSLPAVYSERLFESHFANSD